MYNNQLYLKWECVSVKILDLWLHCSLSRFYRSESTHRRKQTRTNCILLEKQSWLKRHTNTWNDQFQDAFLFQDEYKRIHIPKLCHFCLFIYHNGWMSELRYANQVGLCADNNKELWTLNKDAANGKMVLIHLKKRTNTPDEATKRKKRNKFNRHYRIDKTKTSTTPHPSDSDTTNSPFFIFVSKWKSSK